MATEAKKAEGGVGILVWGLGIVASIAVVTVVLAAFIHFFVGADIWLIEAKNTGTAAYWGQLGDFIGGMLNPVLSFFALLAVLISLRSQSAELRAARAEAKAAQTILEQQTSIAREQSRLFERQNFESAFFGLLGVFSKSVDSVTYYDGTQDQHGKKAFKRASKQNSFERLILVGVDPGAGAEFIRRYAEETIWEKCGESFVGHFQLLLEVLVYIDSFGSPVVSHSFKEWRQLFISNMALDSVETELGKKSYARIIKASLSPGEKVMLAVYCMTSSGIKICDHVAKFGLLEDFRLKINDEHFQEALRKVGAIRATKDN